MDLTNPLKAIRAKCLDCSNDYVKEVTECPITDCPLYPFRFGKNPYRAKRVMSEEQKAKQAEILRKYREEKSKASSGE